VRARSAGYRLAILGIAVFVACAAALFGTGGAEDGSESWNSYEDDGHGLSVEFPPSWERAASPMFARIVNPRSILALSTFAIPRGAGRGECGVVPSQVTDGAGRTGAAVLVSETYREPGGASAKVVRRTPQRPARFRLSPESEARTPGEPAREWLLSFMDGGRLLTAAVVLGPDAPAGLRADAVGVLNSLRFRPPEPGRES
jgi:hypothetical protein